MAANNTDTSILGVLVISRHGDRNGFYQTANSYEASDTHITPLGETQHFQLGGILRDTYLDSNSDLAIASINSTLVDSSQVQVRADAGGEGAVIFDSAVANSQGLFPPTNASSTVLANGTTVVSPLNGYQYVGIESVYPDTSVEFEGWTDCKAFEEATTKMYGTAAWKEKEQQNQDLLNAVKPFVGNRTVSLDNFYNVFDFMNVNSIHNRTYAESLPDGLMEQVRDLANYHENAVYSAGASKGEIQQIAITTVIPSIISSLDEISNGEGHSLRHYAMSYKPFISFFDIYGLSASNPSLAGLVDYASALAFEVHSVSDSSEDQFLRLRFKNGTDDFVTLVDNTPIEEFKSSLEPYGINSLKEWCSKCDITDNTRGCKPVSDAPITSTIGKQDVSPLASGFIGAVVTLGIFAILCGIFAFFGIISFSKPNHKKNSIRRSHENSENKKTLNRPGSDHSSVASKS